MSWVFLLWRIIGMFLYSYPEAKILWLHLVRYIALITKRYDTTFCFGSFHWKCSIFVIHKILMGDPYSGDFFISSNFKMKSSIEFVLIWSWKNCAICQNWVIRTCTMAYLGSFLPICSYFNGILNFLCHKILKIV